MAEKFLRSQGTKAYDDLAFAKFIKGSIWLQSFFKNGSIERNDQILKQFLQASKGMSATLIKNSSRFDLLLMAVGIVFLWQVSVISSIGFDHTTRFQNDSMSRKLVAVILTTIVIHITLCIYLNNDSCLCFDESNSYLTVITISVSFFFIYSLNWSLIFATRRFRSLSKIHGNSLEDFLFIGSIIHAISLSASSFVEEEHQIYYFLITMLLLLIALLHCKYNDQHKMFCAISGMVIQRISRSWNTTGDKWINEPAIADWLNAPQNKLFLNTFVVIAMISVFIWISKTQQLHKSQRVITGMGLMGILFYRMATGALDFGIPYPLSRGIIEAGITYSLVAAIMGTSKRGERIPSFIAAWIVFTMLLKRPHHLPLISFQLLQYSLLKRSLQGNVNYFCYGLAHYWIGMNWFFQQGNGNSLTRIDVSSAYVGLFSYNFIFSGILLSCATYSGPILAALLGLEGTTSFWKYAQGFLWNRSLIVAVFVIIVMILRSHLFIWSVFSPKLLYEGTCSVMIIALFILIHL